MRRQLRDQGLSCVPVVPEQRLYKLETYVPYRHLLIAASRDVQSTVHVNKQIWCRLAVYPAECCVDPLYSDLPIVIRLRYSISMPLIVNDDDFTATVILQSCRRQCDNFRPELPTADYLNDASVLLRSTGPMLLKLGF